MAEEERACAGGFSAPFLVPAFFSHETVCGSASRRSDCRRRGRCERRQIRVSEEEEEELDSREWQLEGADEIEEAGDRAAFASYAAASVAHASSCVTGGGCVGIGMGAEIAGRRLCVFDGDRNDLILESMIVTLRTGLESVSGDQRSDVLGAGRAEAMGWSGKNRCCEALYTCDRIAADHPASAEHSSVHCALRLPDANE